MTIATTHWDTEDVLEFRYIADRNGWDEILRDLDDVLDERGVQYTR